MGSVVISDIELMKNLLAHFLAAPRSQKQSAQNSTVLASKLQPQSFILAKYRAKGVKLMPQKN